MKPTITKADIVRVYSGLPGCACGCRGTYSESKAQITRVMNMYNALPEGTKVNTSYRNGELEFVYWDSQNGNRTYTIYTKAYE